MSFSERVNEGVLPKVMKFINAKPVLAIKDGMIYAMPLSIIGSLFLLLAEFPWDPIKNFFVNVGWAPAMYQANSATIGIMALVVVFGIASTYAKNERVEPVSAGFVALVAYFLLLDWRIPAEEVEGGFVAGIPTNWIGSEGIIAAILIGLSVGYIYSFLLKREIRIKMPDTVPSGVANSFNALVPMGVVTLLSAILYGVLNSMDTSFLEIIYTVLQTPLQGMSDSIGMAFVVPLTIHFLWWFGIHGATTVLGVVEPLLLSNSVNNLELYKAGQLSFENGARALTAPNTNTFMTPTGSGMTFGILMFMIFFAKSEQFKTLGKLAFGSSLFNINEPIIFGTPIVLNPSLFIPFVLVPTFGYVSSFLLMRVGILALPTGVVVPWTTPPIIQGFLAGGWTWAVYQAILLVVSTAAYYPFMRQVDKQAYLLEQGMDEKEILEAM